MGSAFLRMNSSTSIPSMVGGRRIRFCFPLMKMVMYSFCLRFFSAFSAAVSFRLRFAMMVTALYLSRCHESYVPANPEAATALLESPASAVGNLPVLDPRGPVLTLWTSSFVNVGSICSIHIATICTFGFVRILRTVGYRHSAMSAALLTMRIEIADFFGLAAAILPFNLYIGFVHIDLSFKRPVPLQAEIAQSRYMACVFLISDCSANRLIFSTYSGQLCSVSGSKSAPFGHTNVCTSGSIST